MRRNWIVGLVLLMTFFAGSALAQTAQAPLTLAESIKMALERSPGLHSAQMDILGSEFRRKEAITNFLPQWTGLYSYTKYSYQSFIGNLGASSISSDAHRNVFNFGTTVEAPLYTGGANWANYYLQKLGVDISKVNVESVKLDTVLAVRVSYFSVLRTEKFVDTAKQAVKQFEAQLDVAKAFFDVGIVAKNDVLQAEVRLANAVQAQVRAENDAALAKATFNTLLRRDVTIPVILVDILEYKPSAFLFEECLQQALEQRPEIKAAELSVSQAKETVKIARSGLLPTISIAGNYGRTSSDLTLEADSSSARWSLQTLATFTLFDWGNTYYKVGESKVKVTQAEDTKSQLVDRVTLEVQSAYLDVVNSEKNIIVAQKSIEQAEENQRMNEERYKYQVATATDVLDAVTLLAQARVNYYGALSDYNTAIARLERNMGKKTYQ